MTDGHAERRAAAPQLAHGRGRHGRDRDHDHLDLARLDDDLECVERAEDPEPGDCTSLLGRVVVEEPDGLEAERRDPQQVAASARPASPAPTTSVRSPDGGAMCRAGDVSATDMAHLGWRWGFRAVGDGLTDQVDLVVSETRVQRQRQQPFEDPVCTPEAASRQDGVGLEVVQAVDRDEVHRRRDTSGGELPPDVVAPALGHPDRVQVPGVDALVRLGPVGQRHEALRQDRPDRRRTARRARGGAAARSAGAQLRAPDRSLEVGEVGLEACLLDVVAPASAWQVAAPGVGGHPVQPGAPHPGVPIGVVGGDHAALADRAGSWWRRS